MQEFVSGIYGWVMTIMIAGAFIQAYTGVKEGYNGNFFLDVKAFKASEKRQREIDAERAILG